MLELLTLFLTVILFIYILKSECLQKPKTVIENMDNIEGMNKKMEELQEKEKETRMFCKLLRHKERKDDIDYMIENNNLKFKNELEKQNQMITDIKKKIINIKLDKVDSDFIKFNEEKNAKEKSFMRRKQQIEKAKHNLRQPKKINLKINNNF